MCVFKVTLSVVVSLRQHIPAHGWGGQNIQHHSGPIGTVRHGSQLSLTQQTHSPGSAARDTVFFLKGYPCSDGPHATLPVVSLAMVSTRPNCSSMPRHSHTPNGPLMTTEQYSFIVLLFSGACRSVCVCLSASRSVRQSAFLSISLSLTHSTLSPSLCRPSSLPLSHSPSFHVIYSEEFTPIICPVPVVF